jgi:zinc protease
MLKRALVALAFTLLATASPAQTRPAPPLPAGIEEVTRVEGITEYRLKNGLQLLLVPDDSKPSTTVNVTYRVGSRLESYGETGMAHLLEHLLFKGTPTTRNLWPSSLSGACAPTATLVRPPTTSPPSRRTTTTCAGTSAGRPTR